MTWSRWAPGAERALITEEYLQIQDGEEFRVLITPRPPQVEDKKEAVKNEEVVKTQKKKEEKKKIVKVEVKPRGLDQR